MDLDNGGKASLKLLGWVWQAKGGPVLKQKRVLTSLGQMIPCKMEAGFALMEYVLADVESGT